MRIQLFLAFALTATVACIPDKRPSADVQMAVFKNYKARPDSMLRVLHKSGGKLTTCVFPFGGANAGDWNATQERIRSAVASAVNEWNSQLAGLQEWPVRGTVEVKIESNFDRCHIRIYDFQTYESQRETGQMGSNADLEWRAISIVQEEITSNATRLRMSTTDYEKALILHEFGHLLGLADTYRKEGYTENIGAQPDAVMKGFSDDGTRRITRLTADDKASLLTMVGHVFLDKPLACPTGYKTMNEARGSQAALAIFCEPASGPVAPGPAPAPAGRCTAQNAPLRICAAREFPVFDSQGREIGRAHPGEPVCDEGQTNARQHRLYYFPNPPAGRAWVPDSGRNVCRR